MINTSRTPLSHVRKEKSSAKQQWHLKIRNTSGALNISQAIMKLENGGITPMLKLYNY